MERTFIVPVEKVYGSVPSRCFHFIRIDVTIATSGFTFGALLSPNSLLKKSLSLWERVRVRAYVRKRKKIFI